MRGGGYPRGGVTSLSEGMTLLGEKDYDTRGREEVDDVTGGEWEAVRRISRLREIT